MHVCTCPRHVLGCGRLSGPSSAVPTVSECLHLYKGGTSGSRPSSPRRKDARDSHGLSILTAVPPGSEALTRGSFLLLRKVNTSDCYSWEHLPSIPHAGSGHGALSPSLCPRCAKSRPQRSPAPGTPSKVPATLIWKLLTPTHATHTASLACGPATLCPSSLSRAFHRIRCPACAHVRMSLRSLCAPVAFTAACCQVTYYALRRLCTRVIR